MEYKWKKRYKFDFAKNKTFFSNFWGFFKSAFEDLFLPLYLKKDNKLKKTVHPNLLMDNVKNTFT